MIYDKDSTDIINIYNESTIDQINKIKENYKNLKIGFTCSAFDIFHAGHVLMLEDARQQCDVLIIGLHTNPTLNRSSKNLPIQTTEERYIQTKSCRYVDDIIIYSSEKDLYNILTELNPNVRVLGTDWKDKEYTGHELPIPIHLHKRDHNWSTSTLRSRIYEEEKNKKEKEKILFNLNHII